jgi:uncharacterized coiled-coil protein SlyX
MNKRNEFDPDAESEFDPDDFFLEQEDEHPSARHRFTRVLLIAAALAIIGVTGYVWFGVGSTVENAKSQAQVATPSADPVVVAKLDELSALQQQSLAKIDALERRVAAGQDERKRLSDQLAVLESRLNALPSATIAPAVSFPPTPLLNPEVDRGAQALLPPSKKPAKKSKSSGPVSIGGAPLPPEQDSN